jgi:hypothetical protein
VALLVKQFLFSSLHFGTLASVLKRERCRMLEGGISALIIMATLLQKVLCVLDE